MRNIFLFALLVVIAFLSGCNKCQKKNLSRTDTEWVIHFNPGAAFFYKSLKGDIDTLEVVDTSRHYTLCNKTELSEYQYEIYTVRLKIKSKHSYNNDEPFISVTTEDWQQNNPYIYFGNLGPHRNDLDNKPSVAIDTVLDGVKLKSVYYYAKGLNTEQYGQEEYFKNFFWDKQTGLIAYTTVKGEVFMRINK